MNVTTPITPRQWQRVRVALLLAASVLAAGCTTTVTGTPSASSTPASPSRPREVRLDGVDPCSLLNPEQRAGLGFTSQPATSRPYVPLFHGDVPTCTMDSPSADPTVLGIGLVTSVGIERWREGNLAAGTESTAIEGFPALIARPTQSARYCAVEVDVSTGQLLDVQFLDGGHSPPLPQDDLCSRATRSAAEVVKSLLAR